MWKYAATVSATASFLIASIILSVNQGSLARPAQGFAQPNQSVPRIDVQKLLAGQSAADFPAFQSSSLETAMTLVPEQIASGGWISDIEAGSDDGGNNHCTAGANGTSVTSACSAGVYGFQFLVEMFGQQNCTGSTYCKNPSGTGATCGADGAGGVRCYGTKLGAGIYSVTISSALQYPQCRARADKCVEQNPRFLRL